MVRYGWDDPVNCYGLTGQIMVSTTGQTQPIVPLTQSIHVQANPFGPALAPQIGPALAPQIATLSVPQTTHNPSTCIQATTMAHPTKGVLTKSASSAQAHKHPTPTSLPICGLPLTTPRPTFVEPPPQFNPAPSPRWNQGPNTTEIPRAEPDQGDPDPRALTNQ